MNKINYYVTLKYIRLHRNLQLLVTNETFFIKIHFKL